MALMTTTLPPLTPRRGPSSTNIPPSGLPASQLALAELFPDVKAAADEALAELFPALRVRMRAARALDVGRR